MMLKWVKIFVTVGLLLIVIGVARSEEAKKEKPKIEKVINVYLPSQISIYRENGEEVCRQRISTGRGWTLIGKSKGKKKKYRTEYTVLYKDPRGAKSRSVKKDKNGKVIYNVLTPWKFGFCQEKDNLLNFHEYFSVPSYAASHGCVREKKGEGKFLYDKVEVKKTKIRFFDTKAPEKPKTTPKQKPEPKTEPKQTPPSGGV
ncbi:MAG: L,D-transpeptidase [Candidatus Berkelbacteria bacterium]|nr:L,D-transpeptidase [Candidatus Berkelbacteria bacterium]